MNERSCLHECERYAIRDDERGSEGYGACSDDDERPGAIKHWLGTSPPKQTDNSAVTLTRRKF
ncbi:MAG: hypothetical protein EOM51_02225 [Clostridia bacterium]|nr:hypothetical protein [Clostridia bacterium]